MSQRTIDTRYPKAGFTAPAEPPQTTSTPSVPLAEAGRTLNPEDGALVLDALRLAQSAQAAFGLDDSEPACFVADNAVQRTHAGAAVHLQQVHRGIPVFEMTRTVRYIERQAPVAIGHSIPVPSTVDALPATSAAEALGLAIAHLLNTDSEVCTDAWGQKCEPAQLDVADYQPQQVASFPLPTRPTVLSSGPFATPPTAYLVWFPAEGRFRLSWRIELVYPEHEDAWEFVVAADSDAGVLLARSTLNCAQAARGQVYETNPGDGPRKFIDFPQTLPELDHRLELRPWVDTSQTVGNFTDAVLSDTGRSMTGTIVDGKTVFDTTAPEGDEQKVLNIFYFCNRMHDFFEALGFDARAGAFQRDNAAGVPGGGDSVSAHAHSGPVSGTANMRTPPDGQAPRMNMGLVASTNRHTALDCDVVYHEFVHGVSNRLVGGRLDSSALRGQQGGAMGEGWSDFFALTFRSFPAPRPKEVSGDWVLRRPGGVRQFPFNSDYPGHFGLLGKRTEKGAWLGVHAGGEIWCATLMEALRRTVAELDTPEQAYRVIWQTVVDGMKLTQARPTFLDARDAIFASLPGALVHWGIQDAMHNRVKTAFEGAFARFGMGASAFCPSDRMDNCTPDFTGPDGQQSKA